MGYTTDFVGQFNLNRQLDGDTHEFLTRFNETRRMKRKVDKKYGVEGEFYVLGDGFSGQKNDPTIVSYNDPPQTQPGLWCQWKPSKDGMHLIWDGGEKFYHYTEWIQYIIEKILKPRGYILNGEVKWQGEDPEDSGTIRVVKNQVEVVQSGEATQLPVSNPLTGGELPPLPKRKILWN